VVAASLVRALESAGEQREQYWLNRVRPFWQEIWPKDNQKMSQSIAQNLARLSIAARNEFPSALSTVTDWLQPFDSHYIFYLLGESDLCARFPQDVLRLLDLIVSEAFWLGSELGECLDKIASAWPESQGDPHYCQIDISRGSYRICPKTSKIVLKGSFSRRISELKLPKHQILKLSQSNGYNAILLVLIFILYLSLLNFCSR
jgi:hypothetical protein